MSVETGNVQVYHHQFTIADDETNTMAVWIAGSLFDSGRGFITVHTGVSSGPVELTVELLGDPPGTDAAFDEWDNVEEGWLYGTEGLRIVNTNNGYAEGFERLRQLDGSAHGVRVHSRGRGEAWDMIVDTPTEKYLIQLWPYPHPVTRRELKATDGIWTAEPAPDVEEPFDELGADATVRLHGPVVSRPGEDF